MRVWDIILKHLGSQPLFVDRKILKICFDQKVVKRVLKILLKNILWDPLKFCIKPIPIYMLFEYFKKKNCFEYMWSSTFQTIGHILNKYALKHVIWGEVYAREVIVNNLENQPFFGQKAPKNLFDFCKFMDCIEFDYNSCTVIVYQFLFKVKKLLNY